VVLGAALAVAGAAAFAWYARRRWPWVTVGWLWFLGTLVPVIGLVQVGGQALADRYTYLPGIGLALLVAWSIPPPGPVRAGLRLAVGIAAGAAVLALGVATSRQVSLWGSDLELFGHALAVTERNWLAESVVAGELERRGDLAGAREHYRRALAIRPVAPEALTGLGAVEYRLGNTAAAMGLLREAVRQGPRHASALSNLGALLCATGQFEEGLALNAQAAAIAPGDPVVRYNLGCALLQAGRLAEALREFQAAARLDPGDPDARAQVERLGAQGVR
jgi:tetratricopeptide (TPR) repeat protein